MNTNLSDLTRRMTVRLTAARTALAERTRDDERGEGVISAAIAVLIMAFIGVAAFAAFKGIMTTVTDKAEDCVTGLGGAGATC